MKGKMKWNNHMKKPMINKSNGDIQKTEHDSRVKIRDIEV